VESGRWKINAALLKAYWVGAQSAKKIQKDSRKKIEQGGTGNASALITERRSKTVYIVFQERLLQEKRNDARSE
jgi:hypothetical protein